MFLILNLSQDDCIILFNRIFKHLLLNLIDTTSDLLHVSMLHFIFHVWEIINEDSKPLFEEREQPKRDVNLLALHLIGNPHLYLILGFISFKNIFKQNFDEFKNVILRKQLEIIKINPVI